jgi:hypothetical protein
MTGYRCPHVAWNMVRKELKKLPGAREAHVVQGEFDLMARIELGHVTLIDETLAMACKPPGVARTSTLALQS